VNGSCIPVTLHIQLSLVWIGIERCLYYKPARDVDGLDKLPCLVLASRPVPSGFGVCKATRQCQVQHVRAYGVQYGSLRKDTIVQSTRKPCAFLNSGCLPARSVRPKQRW
jgi:hypothetical protein